MRRLNLLFLTLLALMIVMSCVGINVIHGVQIRRTASVLLDRARDAERDNDRETAEEMLGWYLSLRPEDGSAWKSYARVVDGLEPGRRRLERVFLVYEQALRHNPHDRVLKRRCVGLAMDLGRLGDAHRLLTELLIEKSPASSEIAPAVEQAELAELLGQADAGLGKYQDAEEWFLRAIQYDRHRVACYDQLARLRRTALRQDTLAASAIEDMIAANPRTGRAYAYRWRYFQEFAPPADEKDLVTALTLGPDDREVLLAAATASAQKRDMLAVRKYLEAGFRLNSKDLDFARGLAQLETLDGRLDRAESLLRRAIEANPATILGFMLAETLIRQGKFSGPNGANDVMKRLGQAGLGDTLVRFLEAESLVQKRNWTDAVGAIDAAHGRLAADPDLSVRLDLMLAECHARLGSDEERLEALRRAAGRDQGSDLARIELVHALARSGRVDEAIAILSPLALSDRNSQWRLDLARLLFQKTIRQPQDRRNWHEVERYLREAEKASPPDAEPITLLRFDVLVAQDRLTEAGKLLTRSLGKEPRNLPYRLAKARLTQLQGRSDEALRIVDEAEQELGPSLKITLARVACWSQRGDAADVDAVAKLAEKRSQVSARDRPDLLDQLRSVALRFGKLNDARKYQRELAELQPDDIRARMTLFDLAIMAGAQDDASHLVEEIRTIEGEKGTNWRFARSVLLIDQARRGSSAGLEEARRLASEIAAEKPNSWVAPALEGEIAALTGSTEHAIAAFLRSLEQGNMQPSFARRLVGLLEQEGRHDDAERVTRILRDQGAALAEVTLFQAMDAIRMEDYDHGLELARQVFSESSSNSADHLNLGRFYLAAGRNDEASKHFQRAVELRPGAAENWFAYIRYLVQVRKLDRAAAAIEASQKALPPDRATLALAQSCLIVGDVTRAEALLHKALEEEGKSADAIALRLAVEINLMKKELALAEEFAKRLGNSSNATPRDQAWANRTRAALLMAKNRRTDRDLALQLVNRNLADAPDDVDDRSLYATILALRPASQGKAIAILEQLAEKNQLGDPQRFLLARLYLGRGDELKYRDEMTKLLALKVRMPQYFTHFIGYWIDRNRLDQADRWLTELKKDDPRSLPAFEQEARLLDLRGRRPELLALLESRIRELPDQIDVVADLLNRYRFVAQAEVACKAYVARDPNQPERILGLARFLALHDRVRESMELLAKASLTCPPESVAAAASLILEAPSAGHDAKRQAEAWLVDALRKRPEATGLKVKLGSFQLSQGRFDEAAEAFRQVLNENPDDADALNCLAWLLALRAPAKVDEALALIDHAIDVMGAVPTLVDTRAVVLIRAGDLDRAVRDLGVARTGAPRNPNVLLHLAWAYQEGGRLDEARLTFQQAKDLGWSSTRSDPLERPFINKLAQKLKP
jgi:tetratricopeptide (TPR) repeat protein